MRNRRIMQDIVPRETHRPHDVHDRSAESELTVPRPVHHGVPARIPRRPPPHERYAPAPPPPERSTVHPVEEHIPQERPYRSEPKVPGEDLFPSRRKHPRDHQNFLDKESSYSVSWILVSGVVVVAALGLALLVSFFFTRATLTVYPKLQENVFIDTTFTAQADPAHDELGYTFMTIEREASTLVPATREEQVEEFATGEITIYNTFDENPQRLIKNTRFEAPDGRIYRIRESIEIPGMSGENPGSVTATIWADQPGNSFNEEGELRFTIPGFEGTARFDAFYAESTTALTGGYSGPRFSVAGTEKEAVRQDLQAQLIEDLERAAFSSSEKPADQHLFEDAVFYDFTELPSQGKGESEIELFEQGTLTAVLFQEDAFARYVASLVIPGYEGEPISIVNPGDLSVSVTRVGTSTSDAISYSVDVTGTATFLWTYNEGDLVRELAGKPEGDLEGILRNYPAIERAEVSMRPFWRSSFPRDPRELTISTVLD